MNIIRFIYCIVIITALASPITLAICCYANKKKPLYLGVIVLFFAFLVDEVVISMTEYIDSFAKSYDATFMVVPTYKTLLYATTFICIIYFFSLLYKVQIQPLLVALLAVLIVLLITIPGLPNNAFKSWIYYFPNQLYSFIFAIYWLVYSKKHEHELPMPELMKKRLKAMLVTLAVFSILIAIEDTYVIFFLDNYNATMLDINNRNHFEDIFRLVIAIQGSILLYQQFMGMIPAFTVENEDTKSKSIAKTDIKFYEFCRYYQLTSREQEIFQLILKGQTTADISENLTLSEGTIKTHTHNIYSKLEVSKKRQAQEKYEAFNS